MNQTPEWRRAARVLRRSGFGATGDDVDAAVRLGLERWVDRALAGGADPGVAATPPPRVDHPRPIPKGADRETKARIRAVSRAQMEQVGLWWLARMAAARNPVLEKLTFGWHNHLAASATKVRDPAAMLAQNEYLRRHALGRFGELAHAMIVDPAMLRWLDGQKNTAKAPNENLAREFMELFALGHDGGYTESDVREGARALTGWRIGPDFAAYLDPKRHDSGTKTVLGVTGNLDAAKFADAVLARPASARFVVTRWWRFLAAPGVPPAPTLERLLKAYGGGRELRPMFRALLLDPAFAQAENQIVTGPVEWLIGAIRALRVPMTGERVKRVSSALRSLGQAPLLPPNVGGWPSGQAWLSTAAAAGRAKFVPQLVAAGSLTPVANAPAARRVDAAAHLLGIGSLSPATTNALSRAGGDPVKLVSTLLLSPEYLVN